MRDREGEREREGGRGREMGEKEAREGVERGAKRMKERGKIAW